MSGKGESASEAHQGPRQWKFSHIGRAVAFNAEENAVVIACMCRRAVSGMRHLCHAHRLFNC